MNVFDDAIDALGDALETAAGDLVRYDSAVLRRSVELTAVRGRSVLNVQSDNGAVIQILSNDWLVTAANLDGLNVPPASYTPAKGDTVTVVTGDNAGEVYELMTPSFSPSDHAGRRLRLHTVRSR